MALVRQVDCHAMFKCWKPMESMAHCEGGSKDAKKSKDAASKEATSQAAPRGRARGVVGIAEECNVVVEMEPLPEKAPPSAPLVARTSF